MSEFKSVEQQPEGISRLQGLAYFEANYGHDNETAKINAALVTATLLRGTTSAISRGQDLQEYGVGSQRLLSDVLLSMPVIDSEEPGWGQDLFEELVAQIGEHQRGRLTEQVADLARTINAYFPENDQSLDETLPRNQPEARQELAANIAPATESMRIMTERIVARHFHTRPLMYDGGDFTNICGEAYFNFIKEAYMNEQYGVFTDPKRTGIPSDIGWRFKKDAEFLFALSEFVQE